MTTSITTVSERKISPFRRVSSSHGIDIQYGKSETYSLKIEAKARLIEQIETTVESGVLKIRWQNKWSGFLKAKFLKQSAVVVYISAPSLNEIDISVGVDFYAEEIHSEGELSINVSNGSGFEAGKLIAAQLILRAGQSSSIKIRALNSSTVDIINATHSDVSLQNIEAGNLQLTASGSSDTELSGVVQQLRLDTKDNSDTDIRELKRLKANQK